METATDPSLQDIPVSLRNLQSATFQHPLTSPLAPDYDPSTFHPYGINEVQHVNGQVQAFATPPPPPPQQRQSLQTPIRYTGGSFVVGPPDLHPPPPPPPQQQEQHQQQQQRPSVAFQVNQDDSPAREIGGHFGGMKAILHPPDLQGWREKLFNVNEMITLTESEFQTYFPHVDNIYSHRSTQRYKRKPFISHYWDCRLKGRPPGTPKTDDPGKKKRRRTARQRDLCDVKIKITEYFPGAAAAMAQPDFGGARVDTMDFMDDGREPAQPFGVLAPSSTLPAGHPGAGGARYYTIQRVNGGSSGRENEGGGHKHTLEESDAIKKNSVKRKMMKEEREKKRTEAPNNKPPTTSTAQKSPMNPPSLCSGLAAGTARRHSKPADLTFFGNPFCPFGQRIWIALEVKEIAYQYVEVDEALLPLPREMLEVNPGKRLPCIKHGNWGAWESSIVMEYLEDLSMGHSLLPLGDPQLRAHCRMWADHINRRIIPSFDCLLTTSLPDKQSSLTAALQSAITDLVNASHITGPFFLGPTISFVDVVFAPWIIRLSRVLKFYRQWPDPEVGTRWERWVQAVERDDRVRGTVSDEVAYHRVYERASKGGLATASVDWEVSNGVVVDAAAGAGAGGAGAGKVI